MLRYGRCFGTGAAVQHDGGPRPGLKVQPYAGYGQTKEGQEEPHRKRDVVNRLAVGVASSWRPENLLLR